MTTETLFVSHPDLLCERCQDVELIDHDCTHERHIEVPSGLSDMLLVLIGRGLLIGTLGSVLLNRQEKIWMSYERRIV